MVLLFKPQLALFLIALFLFTGCNRLYFHPMKEEIYNPNNLGLKYSNIYLTTQDSIKIHGWHLPSLVQKRGTLIFFHGNAENITTHIASIYWLPKHGYDVYIFDYRGYGRSQGIPSIEGVIIDATSVLDYVINNLDIENVIVFGQSLGGAIALNAVAKFENKQQIKSVIIDSSFSGFREIAREKLSEVWITWPFQYPLSFAFTSAHSAKISAAKISPIPMLIIHGNADHIIPIHHGKNLFKASLPPKIFWEIEAGKHIASTSNQVVRDIFLNYMEAAINGKIGQSIVHTAKIDTNNKSTSESPIPLSALN